MLALSRMDRMTRMVVFGMLAFAGSFLLGESYLPTASYFWGLSAGRLLFCFLLVLLPATDAGRFRPTLVGLAVVSLAISALASPFLFSRWAFLTLLYLMLEVSIDALVLTRATEQEVPLELGMLAGCRLSGLWFGLFVQYSGLAEEIHPQRLALGAMLAILVFWVVARESTADRFLPQALRGSEDPSRDHLIKQFSLLANPWTAAALVGLACYSSLAGFHAGAILPYPLINPQDAGSWMNSILENLAILGVGLSGIFLFERLRLRNQLLAAGALTWGLEINDFLHHGSTPFWLWGLLLTSVLLSSRAVLRETYSMDPVFRAAVVITVWTAGGLSGQLAAISVSSSQEVFASLTLASTATLLAVVSWSRYAQAAKEISTPLPPSQHREARFGDRTLDFEAVPEPKRKSRIASGWRRRLNYLLLHLPMYLITVALVAGGFKIGSYIFHNKTGWERRLEDASRRFQTELFLSAFSRRLQEEMLATQRVPTEWDVFISQSFHSNGKPLTDIDFWGKPYRFENNPGEVRVVSAGPDGFFETKDDLEKTIEKPEGIP